MSLDPASRMNLSAAFASVLVASVLVGLKLWALGETGALSVALDIRIEIPKSWSAAKRAEALAGRLHPTGKPDVDNIIKSVYDGLNGVCWVDDAQICNGVQYKRYAAEPGVLVGIKELD